MVSAVLVRENHARLAELHQRHEAGLMLPCALDPALYEAARAVGSSS
jgi:hypothetical protein